MPPMPEFISSNCGGVLGLPVNQMHRLLLVQIEDGRPEAGQSNWISEGVDPKWCLTSRT